VALTFDDGPGNYTSDLLDMLNAAGVKATFFVTGNNNGKGQIDDPTLPWSSIIKRMYSEGHQIASHTWGHQDLSNITPAQRKNQMYYNEMAFNNILGLFPTYMRPPYSSCNSACEAAMAALGYHIVYFDLDTEDYLHDDPNQIQISKNDFSGNLSEKTPYTGDFLAISHDIHYQTVYNLTQFMLNTISANGWKPVTVGQCLGDPAANWYREGSGPLYPSSSSLSFASSYPATSSSSIMRSTTTVSASLSFSSSAAAPTASAYPISTDATCGATAKKTCLGSTFGNCCSVNGWW
jgi:peptidoglycan/xylan/chitin deacetylase (PgdA/CDA1 family)